MALGIGLQASMEQADKTQAKPGRRSIVYYLVALVLISVVPSFIFAGVLIQRNQSAQEDIVETLIVATSRSIVQAMEREIAANITTLHVLAASPSLRDGDFEGFYDRTKLALDSTEAHLFVVNPDFSTFASTRVPYDTPPNQTSDVASAKKAFETNEIVVSDLVLGAVSKRWVYNILLPVDLGPYGKKLIALNQQADNFASALSSNSLPDGWNSALIDNDGRVLAASPGVANVGDQFSVFDPMAQRYAVGWQDIETTAGPALGVLQRSATTGWRLVAWAPVWTINQPLMTTMVFLIAGGFILLGLIVAAMFWVSRRIGQSVRGLARDAQRLGAGQPVAATRYPVSEIAEISEALAQASLDRQSAESDVRFLMREVAHRSKNQMTVIAAMAKQTARSADDLQGYVQAFERRILGLSRSTDLLLTHGRAGISLGDLIDSQIAAFSPDDPARVKATGPMIRLNAPAAQIMGMAVHELSTNAVKYGAFLGDTGSLAVRWKIVDDKLDLMWRETVGEKLPTSERTGFGTTVLKSMVGRSLSADVQRIYHDDGIEWRFVIPLQAIDPEDAAATPPAEEAAE
ncbi:Two-component sensor histidine kinase, contains HisKA and HATPase domains [Devosia psychrophila]|uniref:histidine kinase n=2 Tax=Devosia psychrophila TaxID=728005 RepID=A0A1I1FLB4_9HYPH|nr:Two-component sensor histidine kinase, contains HisKA and HATPase domains [Devosia psychrophila]